jgi:hypothetical protein
MFNKNTLLRAEPIYTTQQDAQNNRVAQLNASFESQSASAAAYSSTISQPGMFFTGAYDATSGPFRAKSDKSNWDSSRPRTEVEKNGVNLTRNLAVGGDKPESYSDLPVFARAVWGVDTRLNYDTSVTENNFTWASQPPMADPRRKQQGFRTQADVDATWVRGGRMTNSKTTDV